MSVGSVLARRANVRVRPAAAEDAVAVAELLVPLEPTVPGTLPVGRGARRARGEHALGMETAAEHLRTRFADPATRTWVATDATAPDEPVVGVVMARFDDAGLIAPTPVLSVARLAVAPGLRRRGIGRALLSACTELAEAAGVHYLASSSQPGARDANRYLARVGFAAVATRRLAPVATVRRSLGLPALGLVTSTHAEPRLARRRSARAAAAGPAGRADRLVHPGA